MSLRILQTIVLAGSAFALATPALALEGNIEAGKKVFTKCAVCHGIGETKKPVGPNLNGVIGRTAGTLEGFKYSKAMVDAGKAGLVWNEAEIMDYIADPKKKIPGNKMAFVGIKVEQERADVAAYVASFTKQ